MMREEPVRAHVDDEALGRAVDPGRDQAVGERLEPGVGFEHPELRRAGGDVVGRDRDADADRGRDPLARRLVPGAATPDPGSAVCPHAGGDRAGIGLRVPRGAG